MKIDVIQHTEWADTKFTLHLISQILGKIKLETAQQEPQWAHVTPGCYYRRFSNRVIVPGKYRFLSRFGHPE